MAARGQGFLAAAHGRTDEAILWLDTAIEVFEVEMPMPFERARTLLARGQVQRRADRRRAARDDLDAAGAVFAVLGARAWSDRATDEAARIGGRRSAGSSLTASERRVAELAVAGRSNLEIAAELVISVRTVESQLSAVYRKLDIRSRALLREALAASSEGATG
jgi:DNA-binding CsgD family transcriptional regulator